MLDYPTGFPGGENCCISPLPFRGVRIAGFPQAVSPFWDVDLAEVSQAARRGAVDEQRERAQGVVDAAAAGVELRRVLPYLGDHDGGVPEQPICLGAPGSCSWRAEECFLGEGVRKV